MRTCLCGCGAQLSPSRRRRPSKFKRGHNNRVPGYGARPSDTQRRKATAAIEAWNARSLVDAEPIRRLLLERFESKREACIWLTRTFGQTPVKRYPYSHAARMLMSYSQRIRRDNAERILRALAELPWEPNARQQRAIDRANERDRKRIQRTSA